MMKRIKFGVIIVIVIVTAYCIISYSIFFLRKSSIDKQIEQEQVVIEQPVDQVVIQGMSQQICQHGEDCYVSPHVFSDQVNDNNESAEIIITQEPQQPLSLIMAEPQEKFSIYSDIGEADQNPLIIQSYSFMTMPVVENVIDPEIQVTLDVLIGNDVDEFVKLILQSNNNIVSKEACRSCGMYAFFNGIKNHKPVTIEEIRILQKLLMNLYQFAHKMKKLSQTPIMRSEQYDALEDLHRSQSIKNDIKLQARLAVTTAALKKLQNIKYNR